MRHATAEHRDEGHDGAEDGVRTCALTRVRRPKDELIRFVLAPDGTDSVFGQGFETDQDALDYFRSYVSAYGAASFLRPPNRPNRDHPRR